MVKNNLSSDQLPPWSEPRTVVEADGELFDGDVSSADYPALKERLVAVQTPLSHTRQSLYRDRFTGQFWLGLMACMGRWSGEIEVLKPLKGEVAESLASITEPAIVARIH